jgi:hypothetical protein
MVIWFSVKTSFASVNGSILIAFNRKFSQISRGFAWTVKNQEIKQGIQFQEVFLLRIDAFNFDILNSFNSIGLGKYKNQLI